jgi:cytidylate kinase
MNITAESPKLEKAYSKAYLKPTRFMSDVITVTGPTAVGSSSTMLSFMNICFSDLKQPYWRFVSAGAIMRQLASKREMDVEQFAEFNRHHPEAACDRLCDEMIMAYGYQNHTFIEGRLPHIFARRGFHVLLTCDLEERAIRRHQHPDYAGYDFADVRKRVAQRDMDDDVRFQRLYPGCLWKESDYDLVVDTEKNQPLRCARMIKDAHTEWLSQLKPENIIWDTTFIDRRS